MPTCPEWGEDISEENLIKDWDATPKRIQSKIRIHICYWQCPSCGHRFRTATRTWIR